MVWHDKVRPFHDKCLPLSSTFSKYMYNENPYCNIILQWYKQKIKMCMYFIDSFVKAFVFTLSLRALRSRPSSSPRQIEQYGSTFLNLAVLWDRQNFGDVGTKLRMREKSAFTVWDCHFYCIYVLHIFIIRMYTNTCYNDYSPPFWHLQ